MIKLIPNISKSLSNYLILYKNGKQRNYHKRCITPNHITKTKRNHKANGKMRLHINGKNATGFFAKIPYKNSFIKVLMTNNHVLDSNDILEN